MTEKSKKQFIYDTVLDAKDICNLHEEQNRLKRGVAKGQKMIVYGRRNSGKTSVVKSIVIPSFLKGKKQAFVMFCDLMEVKDLQSIDGRVHAEFVNSFHRTFPAKAFLNSIKTILKGFSPAVTVDSLTGETTFSLHTSPTEPLSFIKIMEIVAKNISPRIPTLLVFDEFQDIAFVPEAQGLFRNQLQQFRSSPLILMGSKRHILTTMFSKPDAPFADFGQDIEFGLIPYQDYFKYIEERLSTQKLRISFETAKLWQDLLGRNPEAINIVGDYIADHFSGKTIYEIDIRTSISKVVEERQSRFEQLLAFLSGSEEKVLIAIAKYGPVKQPSGKEFLRLIEPTHATVLKAINFLMDHGYLEILAEGYWLTNPLLAYYLKSYR